MDIRKIIKKIIKEEMAEKDEYEVIYSRHYYTTFKDVLFTGNYEECVKAIALLKAEGEKEKLEIIPA